MKKKIPLVGDYTLNVFYRGIGENGVHTTAYADRATAEKATADAINLDTTVHATLTYEPTGRDLIDEPGKAYQGLPGYRAGIAVGSAARDA